MALTEQRPYARCDITCEETNMTVTTQSRTRSILALFWPVALVANIVMLVPASSQANPAFARRFNAKCSMCHAPLPPRLNNLGLTFKRLGYRLPDSNEKGSLVLQDPPSRSLLENFALKSDFRVEKFRDKFTPLSMHEVELMGAGTAGKHLSYSTEVAWEAEEFAMENYEGQLLFGQPETTFTARFGLLNPLLWDKFGHQRLGIARADVLNRRVPVGAFVGFRPRDNSEGVEFGVNLIRLGAEGGGMRSTFLSVGIYNGLTQSGNTLGENNGSKDVLAQVLHAWGENHTIGALWYRGKATNIGTPAFSDTYSRWGVFGNYELRSGSDVLGGFMVGRDDATASTIGRISSRSWFLEVSQTIAPLTAAFARYDRFEPRRPLESSIRRGLTLGVASQPLENLLVTAEYSGPKVGTGIRARDLVLRVVVIY
jgi:hypothetical protein